MTNSHSPILSHLNMLSSKSSLIFLSVVSFAAATSVADRGCVYLNGCNEQVKCCNSQFHCVNTPNGGGNGTCQIWLNAEEDQQVEKECVKSYHQGCNTAADCCQKGLMCAHFAGQPSGVCRHWLRGAKCQTQSDCPLRHLCQGGTCKPTLMVGTECHHSSDCPSLHLCQGGTCRPKFMAEGGCKSSADCPSRAICRKAEGQETGYCKQMILEDTDVGAKCQQRSDCPSRFTCRDGTCRPIRMVGTECKSSSDCPKLHLCQDGTCRPKFMVEGRPCKTSRDCTQLHMCHEGTCKPKYLEKSWCKSSADCPSRAICRIAVGQETGFCKQMILEDLVGQSQDVGCPKCRTVADCPEHAHCGFNGCCQFW